MGLRTARRITLPHQSVLRPDYSDWKISTVFKLVRMLPLTAHASRVFSLTTRGTQKIFNPESCPSIAALIGGLESGQGYQITMPIVRRKKILKRRSFVEMSPNRG